MPCSPLLPSPLKFALASLAAADPLTVVGQELGKRCSLLAPSLRF